MSLFACAPAAAESAPWILNFGYQKSSTLSVILKTNGELEKALAPLGVEIKWHEFTSGLPLVEALNLGHLDFSADVADTVPIFAQAAGAKLVYVADEAASPGAEAILVPAASDIKTLGDLRGRKIAVTKAAGSHFLLLAALQKAGLTFRDISPAYLAPGDGRAAFIGGKVDAWVIWDPFLTSARLKEGSRVLADAAGLASYKRYYLASDGFVANHGDALKIVFAKLQETGLWVKSHPAEAAALLSGIWNIDAAAVEEANSHRSYAVGLVTREGLTEQQIIADAFTREGLIPAKLDASDVKIWRGEAK
nr:aliphatic sulfonate ABC transporter substrate-binding protein [Methylocella silvestris]